MVQQSNRRLWSPPGRAFSEPPPEGGNGVSFREAYGRSGREGDNASGVGYDPLDDSRDLDLGFLIPFPSGFDPGEFRLEGPIGNCFTPPLCGSQGRCGSFSLGVLKAYTC